MRNHFILLSSTLFIFYGTVFLTSSYAQEPEQWISLESGQFNYKIDFPSIPTELTDTIDTEAGLLLLNVAELDCSKLEGYSNLVYMINCTVYPESLIHSDYSDLMENFFTNTINGAVTNISGELISHNEIDYSGYPGREVRISADKGLTFFTSRLYLIRNHFFMMIILTDTKKGDNPDIHKFFDSFRYN
jgi:hypothetical protein